MGRGARVRQRTVHTAGLPPANAVACVHALEVTPLKIGMQEAFGTTQMQQEGATGGTHRSSSCGTADSEEDRVCAPLELNAEEAVLHEWKAISSGIAAIEATQHAIMEKCTSMDNVIATWQADMNWVREDMRVVHEAVERVEEHVCGRTNVTDAGRDHLEGACGSPSPWGSWGDGTSGDQ